MISFIVHFVILDVCDHCMWYIHNCYFSVRLPYNIPHVISDVNFVGNTSVEAENSPVNS